MRSPKKQFYGEVTFDKPLNGIGSVVSYTEDDVNKLKARLHSEASRLRQAHYHICIRKRTPSGWVRIQIVNEI